MWVCVSEDDDDFFPIIFFTTIFSIFAVQLKLPNSFIHFLYCHPSSSWLQGGLNVPYRKPRRRLHFRISPSPRWQTHPLPSQWEFLSPLSFSHWSHSFSSFCAFFFLLSFIFFFFFLCFVFSSLVPQFCLAWYHGLWHRFDGIVVWWQRRRRMSISLLTWFFLINWKL